MTDFHGFTPAAQRFFRSLGRNNNKPWFEANRAIYETAVREPLKALVEELDAAFGTIAPEIIGDPKRSLFRINRDIRFSRPFATMVAGPAFRRRFGPFTSEAMLTRVPRGFAPDHPAAKWLRFQSFTASRNLPSADLPSPKLVGKVVRDFEALVPLVRWINGSLGFKPAKSRL